MTPVMLFKCLSDETRLLCLLLIMKEGELCVCELTESLGLSQPKVSRHLAQLRSCGLVLDRKQGLWSFYRLHDKLPDWMSSVLDTTLAGNAACLLPYLERLHRMGPRPERTTNCL
ncbi:metalloregulator ArsR/SmtB family transcription factor [Granulosicoccus antarcticus]|uniref:HTH-type transcriptional repressor AseR n=1 Tax=Granulosicoccus antarcticus IMCC3135 TaxID=1192854 RepID=A0A2Z2NNH0_9GAMM|nr:metalloregulator ArsR/SmtB family transcription factor [Granulosicoccus antarcticus]ASJ73022.1 HTH-type transcriptional repressor AseR [Granulosicoccus antarcticus IMCC3135]